MKAYNCVYIIINKTNHKQYIGVTSNFQKRMYQHKSGQDKKYSYIDNAIQKEGWDNFDVQIIDNYSTLEERKAKEIYYINKFKTLRSEGGYNLTKGGDYFPEINVAGENNPRALLTVEDVIDIRKRRMNGERLSDVYELYKDKMPNGARAGFSAIWLHISWVNVCPDFIGKYPTNTEHYAIKKRNQLEQQDYVVLENYFKWYGPVRYNTIYQHFKEKIDWETFQSVCKQITEKYFGNKNIRNYRRKSGLLDKMIQDFRNQMQKPPILS